MENLQDLFEPLKELTTDKLLKEKDLLTTPVEIKSSRSYPINENDVTFSIGAESVLSLQLFNDENDQDPDQLIGSDSKLIKLDPNAGAYLKYKLNVAAKANGNVKLKDLGFEFDTTAGLSTAYYIQHGSDEKVRDAFISDISNYLTSFRWSDIQQRLKPNDALSFMATGKLQASLSISWSNILSQSLGILNGLLSNNVTVDINLSPSLKAGVNVSISDTYSYLVKKTSQKDCFISITKTKASKTTGSLGLSVGVAFTKPDEAKNQLTALVDEILRSVFKKSSKEIEDAFKTAKTSTKAGKTISDMAEVLEFAGLPNYVELVEDKWRSLKEQLYKHLEAIAKANAEISFVYEYQRIREGKEILSLTIPLSTLKKYHLDLLKFNSRTLLNDLRSSKVTGASDINYLNESALSIEKSWGFGLKVLGEEVLTGKDFVNKKDTVRTSFDARKMIAQERSTGYKWKLGKGSGKWLSEMIASMKTFSVWPEPLMGEVDFNLYLQLAIRDSRTNLEDLKSYLDLGVLWGALRQQDVETVISNHYDNFKKGSALFEARLVFSEVATKTLIMQCGVHGFNKTNQTLMAQAMAASMPYLQQYPTRTEVAKRKTAYQSLWLDYLTDPTQSTRDLAYKAYSTLKQTADGSALAQLEKSAGFSNAGNFFADVIYTHPGLYNDTIRFFSGVTDLQNRINANVPLLDHFDKAQGKMAQFFTQSFYIKALGAFLLSYVQSNPLLKNEVSKVFTITYGDEGKEQVVNLSIL